MLAEKVVSRRGQVAQESCQVRAMGPLPGIGGKRRLLMTLLPRLPKVLAFYCLAAGGCLGIVVS